MALSYIVPVGKVFLALFFDACKQRYKFIPTEASAPIKITKGWATDMHWWQTALQSSVRTPFSLVSGAPVKVGVASDACPEGAGGVLRVPGRNHVEYFAHVFTASELSRAFVHITVSVPYFELLALTVAIYLWAPHFQGKHVLVECDCLPVVHLVNNGYSKKLGAAHSKGRDLLLILAHLQTAYRFRLSVVHLPGYLNTQSDQLSRQQEQQFLAELPPGCSVTLRAWPFLETMRSRASFKRH
jgi:hypothetical protein